VPQRAPASLAVTWSWRSTVDGRPARCTAVLDSDTSELRADPLRGDERITVQLRS
jgi:hypothetical protein